MADQEYPTLNEVEPSWADVKASFGIYGGVTLTTDDIKAIKWSDKVEVGVVRGTSGGRKRKRTTGQLDNDATITFYKTGWKRFKTALAAVNPKISLVGFDVMVQHTPPGTTEIHNLKIAGCRVLGRSGDMSEGTDADTVEIALNPMIIEEDGVSLL